MNYGVILISDFSLGRVFKMLGVRRRRILVGARRSGRSIPAVGYDGRDNEAPGQKSRRPEDF